MGPFLGEIISNKLHKNSFPESHIFFCHSSCQDCENVVYYSKRFIRLKTCSKCHEFQPFDNVFYS